MLGSFSMIFATLFCTKRMQRGIAVQCKLNEAKTLFVVFAGETKRVGRNATHDERTTLTNAGSAELRIVDFFN